MPLVCRSIVLTTLLFAACDSKITSSVDPAIQEQLETMQDCFPGLFAKGLDLLAIAETWRLNTDGSIPDPDGLVHSGNGPINVTYEVDDCTIAMTIRFYSPAGAEQQALPLTATSLADRIDEAATELRNQFGTGNPFLVGEWTITGTKGGSAFSGGGALTGILGGSTNANELEELRTTTATPAGGPPPIAVNTISEGACTLTVSTDSLVTDSFPTQEYPIGTMTATVDGDDADTDAEVTATLTFDNTAVVSIVLAGTTGGRFLYNLDTRTLTTAP